MAVRNKAAFLVTVLIGLWFVSRLYCIYIQNASATVAGSVSGAVGLESVDNNCQCPSSLSSSLSSSETLFSSFAQRSTGPVNCSDPAAINALVALNANHMRFEANQILSSDAFVRARLPAPSWKVSDLYIMGEGLHTAPRRSKVKVVIGVPTSKRQQEQGHEHLVETLRSLISRSTSKELEQILIVVFLADSDKNAAATLFENIIAPKFAKHIRSGLIDVVATRPGAYPSFSEPLARHTMNDNDQQVKARSKQCIDLALLMEYARGRGEYYLQLEDDVIAAKHYLSSILETVEEAKELSFPWSMLEFARVGFVGKLFRDSELQEIASLFRFYHIDQPADYLMIVFLQLKTQGARYFTKSSLFEHNNRQVTVNGKALRLSDHTFRESGGAGGLENVDDQLPFDRTHFPANPPATIISNINHYAHYSLSGLYRNRRSLWAPVDKASFVEIKFLAPTVVSRIVVKSGHPYHKDDILEQLRILISFDGTSFAKALEEDGPDYEVFLRERRPLLSVRLEVAKNQKFWCILTQLSIYTDSRE